MIVSTIDNIAVLTMLALFTLSGCESGQAQAGQESATEPVSVSSSGASLPKPFTSSEVGADPAVAAAGLPESFVKYGCYACHDVNGARIGPPYRAIAGLYRNDSRAVDKLTQKIINGGNGVWGPIPMIAHPHLAPEQVRPLVEAIIKLN